MDDLKLIDRINRIDSRKQIEEIRLDLYATLIPFVLSTKAFRNNIDTKVFLDKLTLKKELREYLFKSRTQLVARLVREVSKFDKKEMHVNIQVMRKFCNEIYSTQMEEEQVDTTPEEERILNLLNKYSRNRDSHGE